MRYRYVVTGHGPPPIGGSCGHAHATREEAQGCVRRGRSNIERVPVREDSSGCAGVLLVCGAGVFIVFCGGALVSWLQV